MIGRSGEWAASGTAASAHRVLLQLGRIDLCRDRRRRDQEELLVDQRGRPQPLVAGAHPLVLAEVDPAAYDAVYIPGGHAPMLDLVEDPSLAALLTTTRLRRPPGRRALPRRRRPTRRHRRRPLALPRPPDDRVHRDTEEQRGGYGDSIPFSVEQRMRTAGGIVETGDPWSDTVIVDGTLITGQNPQSSVSTAKALLERLA